MPQVIVDTSPLVAMLNKQDQYHSWVIEQLKQIQLPLLTCEAVLVETCFLLHKQSPAQVQSIFNALQNDLLHISFQISDEVPALQEMIAKYTSVPMSLADACLVRMSEHYPQAKVFTLDSDFHIYRKNRNEIISCIIPPER